MNKKARIEKVVSQLPSTLEKNTIYYVRVGNGFEIYVTNDSGFIVAYPANYVKIEQLQNLVTTNTEQAILSRKNFYSFSGGSWTNNTLMVYATNANPAMNFYKEGINVGQLGFDGGGFHLWNGDATNYFQIKSAGFIKNNSDDSYVLTGGGGHKLISDFATSTQLGNYVTIATPQEIEARKVFRPGTGNSYDTASLEVRGSNASGIFPTISFHQPGSYAGTISMRNSTQFQFRNTDDSDFVYLYGAGFIKNGSDANHVLLGDGDHKPLSDFATAGNYVTIDTPQTIIADKTLSQTAKLTILGNETYGANNTQSFNQAEPYGNIVSGWLNTFYGNRWKYGIVRGGDSSANEVKFCFDFSPDNGITYNRMLSIDANSGSLELKDGGAVKPNGNIIVRQNSSGGDVTGLYWYNNSYNTLISGIGALTTNGILNHNYIGWGAVPWDSATNLSVGENVFSYKGNQVWHSGNFNPDTKVNKSGDTMTGGLTVSTPDSVGSNNLGSLPTNLKLYLSNGTDYGTVFWNEGSGQGYIQQQRADGNPTAYRLNLQPYGGQLFYGANEVATVNQIPSTANFITTDSTPQSKAGNLTLLTGSKLTINGTDLNHIQSWNVTTGDVGIVSAWVYQHYANRWKGGMKRGGNVDSLGFAFELSTDDGATYIEKFRVQNDSNIVTQSFNSAYEWNQAWLWGNHATAGYATLGYLDSVLTDYAHKDDINIFSKRNTFQDNIIVPTAVDSNHAVNLGQLFEVASTQAVETLNSKFITEIMNTTFASYNLYDIGYPITLTVIAKSDGELRVEEVKDGRSVKVRNVSSGNLEVRINGGTTTIVSANEWADYHSDGSGDITMTSQAGCYIL